MLAPARRQHGAGRHARREPGKGAAIRTGLAHVHRRPRAHPGRRPRVRPRGLAQAARAGAAGQGARSSTARASPASAATCCSCTGSATASCRSSPTCSTTRRSPTWRPVTSSSTARCSTASTLRAERFDFEPEITAKILRAGHPHLRGADLVHRPRVRRGQEDHVARRLRRALDARQVPLRRLTGMPRRRSARSSRARRPSGRGGRELRGGAAPPRRACARCSPTTSAGAARDRRGRQRLGRRLGRRAARARSPTSRVVDPARNLGYAGAANLGIAATTGARRRGLQPRPRRRRRAPRRRCSPGSTPSPISPRWVPRCSTPTARCTRRPARTPSTTRRASATRCSVGSVARATASPVATASSTPTRTGPATSTGCRARRSGCAASALDAVGGLGRALLHVPRGRRPVLAPAPARLAGRVRARGCTSTHVQGASTSRRPYRMIVEHHRSAYRFAARRWRGPRRLLLVPAAVLPRRARAAVDMAARALRTASRDAQGQRVTCHTPCPSPGPGISAPPCAPGTASRSASAAGRSGGTSRSPSIVIVGIVAVVPRAGRGDSAGAARPAPPTRPRTCPATTGTPRSGEHLRRVAQPAGRSSRSRPTTRTSRPTPASTPTATA